MLVRTVLAQLRAKAPKSSVRDVVHTSRQLAHTHLTSSSSSTGQFPFAPAVESFRTYATATATATRTKAKPRPKAKAKAKAKATIKKGRAKKTATRKTAAKKPVKKAAAKKPVKKNVAAKKSAPKRKVLTPRQKLLQAKAKKRAEITKLKQTALVEPKRLPQTAWMVYLIEIFRSSPAGERSAGVTKKASESFKTLSPSELERLQNVANENARENKEIYKRWLHSHTPHQILEANRARAYLKRNLAIYKKGKIQDDRRVKAPTSSYLHYFLDLKKAGGADMTFTELARKAGQGWKTLPASQKQKYEDAGRQDRERYAREYKNTYGMEIPPQARQRKV